MDTKWLFDKRFFIPANIANTFLALSDLYLHNPKLFGGREFAKITRLLTSIEVEEGGPYKPKDIATNSAIAYFLSLVDITLPKLNAFLEESTDTKPKKYTPSKPQPVSDRHTDKIHQQITLKAEHELQNLEKPLKSLATKKLKRLLKSNMGKQITLLPYLFKESLGKVHKKIPQELILDLGLANLFGWLTYEIYDDFLDDNGETELLPVANVFLRKMITTFNELAPNQRFKLFLHNVLNQIDSANIQELKNRATNTPPKVKALATKSFGHALGPIAILFYLGFDTNSLEVKKTVEFFTHFLIAKQLNDDAHDWEEDLKNKHITPVTAKILDKASSNKNNTQKLRELFWNEVLPEICDQINHHLTKSRKALYTNPSILKPHTLATLITPIKEATQKAQYEQKETLAFIKAYS